MPAGQDHIDIRQARPADLRALARLGAALVRQHHAMDPRRFFLEEPLERGYAWWLGKELQNPRAVILSAVRRARGSRLVGYAYGRLDPRDWSVLRDRCGTGVDLFVDPGWRGRGVGRRLVEALGQRLAALGAPRLIVQVAWPNRTARGLFAAMGFRPTMVEMTRELEPQGGGSRARRGAARRRPAGRAEEAPPRAASRRRRPALSASRGRRRNVAGRRRRG